MRYEDICKGCGDETIMFNIHHIIVYYQRLQFENQSTSYTQCYAPRNA